MDTTPGATAVDPDTANLPLAELEERVVGLAGRLASAMCEWLLLLAEFDAREGWGASAGIRSTVHWLSWRCGIAGATAAEQVRVARCLAVAPVLSAAFASGQLSYSQVRAVSRGLSIVPEADLVDMALHATGAQLDRLVAGLKRATTPDEEAARRQSREASWYLDDDGMLMLRARLSADEAAIVLTALQHALRIAQAAAQEQARVSGDEGAVERIPVAHQRADALVAVAAAALAHTDVESPGVEPSVTLHVDLDTLNALAHAPDASASGDNSPTTRATVAKSRTTADGAAAQRAGADAAANGATTAATPDDRRTDPGTGTGSASDSSAEDTSVDIGTRTSGTAAPPAEDTSAHTGSGSIPVLALSEFDGGIPAHISTVARLLCDADIRLIAELVSGEGVDLGRARRVPTRRLRRAILRRDGHRCQFPGCCSTVGIHLHHVRHWIHGGTTNADNLVALCGTHHRMLHEGNFAIAPATIDPETIGPAVGDLTVGEPSTGASGWRFYTPNGTPIPERPPMRTAAGVSVTDAQAYEAAAASARQITNTEGRGYPVNWSYATDCILSALQHRADHAAAKAAA